MVAFEVAGEIARAKWFDKLKRIFGEARISLSFSRKDQKANIDTIEILKVLVIVPTLGSRGSAGLRLASKVAGRNNRMVELPKDEMTKCSEYWKNRSNQIDHHRQNDQGLVVRIVEQDLSIHSFATYSEWYFHEILVPLHFLYLPGDSPLSIDPYLWSLLKASSKLSLPSSSTF